MRIDESPDNDHPERIVPSSPAATGMKPDSGDGGDAVAVPEMATPRAASAAPSLESAAIAARADAEPASRPGPRTPVVAGGILDLWLSYMASPDRVMRESGVIGAAAYEADAIEPIVDGVASGKIALETARAAFDRMAALGNASDAMRGIAQLHGVAPVADQDELMSQLGTLPTRQRREASRPRTERPEPAGGATSVPTSPPSPPRGRSIDVERATGAPILAGDDPLTRHVIALLYDSAPMRARAIARRLVEAGFGAESRRDVNRVLYAHLDRFVQDANWEWTLAGSVVVVAPPPEKPRAQPPEAAPPPIPRPAKTTWPHDGRLYEWQRCALTAWVERDRRGIVEAVTGSGKTRVGLAAIEQHVARQGAAVVIVPTIALMDQWTDELAAWLGCDRAGIVQVFGGRRDRLRAGAVSVAVVNTAATTMAADVAVARRAGTRVLLVADECHRYGAATFRDAIQVPADATLGLSATPERASDYGMEEAVIPALGDVCMRYGYEEALRDRVIAVFEVAFVGLEFEPDEQAPYDELTHEIGQLQQALKNRYPELHGGEFIPKLHVLQRRTDDPAITKWFALTGERTNLLQSAGARADFVAWLVEHVRHGRQTFLFHQSIAGAEWLADALVDAGISAAAHHSEKSPEERDVILRAFRRGELQAITAVKTLDEGIDVPDASVAVIAAGSTVRRQRIQRIGRILRPVPGKKARILICYVTGSRDDPAARSDPDSFFEEMRRLNRVASFTWPGQEATIRDWVLGGSEGGDPDSGGGGSRAIPAEGLVRAATADHLPRTTASWNVRPAVLPGSPPDARDSFYGTPGLFVPEQPAAGSEILTKGAARPSLKGSARSGESVPAAVHRGDARAAAATARGHADDSTQFLRQLVGLSGDSAVTHFSVTLPWSTYSWSSPSAGP